jgi:hypothetical protein
VRIRHTPRATKEIPLGPNRPAAKSHASLICTRTIAPARTRTRNSSLEARHDHPFHHQGHGSSHTSALTRIRTRNSSLGPRRDGPLHHQGIQSSGPPGSRTPISWLQARRLSVGPAARIHRIVPEGVEPPFPLCKRGVVAIGPRDGELFSLPSSTGGSRTHRHQALDLTAMPVRVPCHPVASVTQLPICGPGIRTTASELMKLGRAPARPQCPRPRYRTGQVGLMRANRTPATPGSFQQFSATSD